MMASGMHRRPFEGRHLVSLYSYIPTSRERTLQVQYSDANIYFSKFLFCKSFFALSSEEEKLAS